MVAVLAKPWALCQRSMSSALKLLPAGVALQWMMISSMSETLRVAILCVVDDLFVYSEIGETFETFETFLG